MKDVLSLRGTDIPIEVIEGEKRIYLNLFIMVLNDFTNSGNLPRESKYMAEGDCIKKKKNKSIGYYVNGSGLLTYIAKSFKMHYVEKKQIVEQLKYNGMIDENIEISNTKKELDMLSAVHEFFVELGHKVKSQVPCSGYCIDMVIGKIAIEYDENKHSSYDKTEEKDREKTIISNGYKLVRINDSDSIIKNLAKISKVVI